jgi:hypothetical protein
VVRLDDAMRAMIELVAHDTRVSKARVRAAFALYLPHLRWSDAAYARAMRRRQLETPASAAYFEQFRAMTADELTRALKGIDNRIAKYSRIFGTEPGAKPKGERLTLKQLQVRRRFVQNELRRRARTASPPPSPGCVLPSEGEHGVMGVSPEPEHTAPPALPAGVDIGYVQRLVAIGDDEAIHRHCFLRRVPYPEALHLAAKGA